MAVPVEETGISEINVYEERNGIQLAKARGIGLDIGTSAIKAIELQQSPAGMELLHYAVLPVPAGTIRNGVITNPADIGAVIKHVFKTGKIHDKEVYVAIAGQSVVVRQVRFPDMPADEVHNAIQWEADKYLPFSPEEAVIDFHIIGPAESEGEIEVMLVAAQNELVNSHVAAIEVAGLTPVAMDVQPFAILRSLGLESLESQRCSGLIDIGAGTTDVVIFKGDSLKFTRIIPFGGQRFTEAVAEGMNCGFSEADDMKLQAGKVFFGDEPEINDPNDLSVKIFGILRPVLEEFLLEVRRSIDYYKLQNRGESIDELVLTGGGSKLVGLERMLEGELGIPARIGNPFENIKINPRQFNVATLTNLAPMLAVGIGLALRGVEEA